MRLRSRSRRHARLCGNICDSLAGARPRAGL